VLLRERHQGHICSAIDGGDDKAGCADVLHQELHQGRDGLRQLRANGQESPAERLASAGREVSNALCEHFAMSRQQLFDLVAVKAIRSFTALIAGHGTGRGCDICKPAVASILASQTSAHVLDETTVALQDTNDAFLGNIQRNGTYSVVPRVPGGSSPRWLDRDRRGGARLRPLHQDHRRPADRPVRRTRRAAAPIWRRLVDAGFESGHAYGKSLRTVKSCVGSTWCRYGVQDSAKLAIDLELRYRGLRSPHKLKGGVSGCARECAEARGKDFGVIATEKGWNLYVGGNGGFRPAHARLLAIDLDTQTLIRYLDRFLMFYIRTADRLQRTSAWLESIEGGLDYVRSVVVDDILGLAADLEADMARHIGAYEDEWRATLDDEEKLAASCRSSTPRARPTRASRSSSSAIRSVQRPRRRVRSPS
jgi:nitrite reductase (NADH) large subunit